jgi:hypothetical protein
MRETIARWESTGGRYWVELYRDQWGYGYDGKGCGGNFGKDASESEVMAFMDRNTAGGAGFFHPGTTAMKRVDA